MSTVSTQKLFTGRIWLISYLVLLLIVAGAGWSLTEYLGDKARQEIIEYNDSELLLHIAHLTGEFNKIERAVRILSESPSIVSALVSLNEHDIATAGSTLDRYNLNLNSSVCYLMDSRGKTVASSNRNDSDSFVGKSYQFRPYFTQAIHGVPSRYFALGATSLKRGFYASYPVRDGKNEIIGVAVIKQDVDGQEPNLTKYPYCFIVDPDGIIFLSGKNEMKFKSLWPVSREAQLALLKSKQFGDKEFTAVLPKEVEDGVTIEFDGRDYLVSRKAFNPEGWSIVLMTTTERILIYKSAGVILTILICALIIVLLMINYNIARSAEMLRENEQKFRAVFEQAFQLVGMMTTDGILLSANKAALMLSGVKETDVIGKPFWEAPWWSHSPELQETLRLAIKKAAAGELVRFDATHPAADGSIRHVDFSLRPVVNDSGKVIFLVPEGRDITERKQAEEALKDRERTLGTLIGNLPGFVYRCANDRDWTMEFISNGCLDVTGYGPDEFIGNKNVCYNDIIHPDFCEPLWEKWQDLLKRKASFEGEYPIITRDGETRWVWERGTGIYSEDGQLLFLEGFITDITERKRSDAELDNSFKRLRAALGGTIQTLAIASETRDPYTAGHQKKVADLSRAIATEMGLDSNRTDGIRMAGVIHDLGKMAIPAEILSKPSRLSAIEYKLIKTHPQAGYDILKDVEFPWPIAQVILQHHERLDGSGYPAGLKGDEILMEARIIAVADVVEAITSFRPYRQALGIEKALGEITQNKGIFYDPAVVDACLRLFSEKGYKFV